MFAEVTRAEFGILERGEGLDWPVGEWNPPGVGESTDQRS